MGTTKSRKSRRNNSRPTAFTFLSNIALGNESEKPPDEEGIPQLSSYIKTADQNMLHYVDETNYIGGSSLHSTDSSFSADEDPNAVQASVPSDSHGRSAPATSPSVMTTDHVGFFLDQHVRSTSYNHTITAGVRKLPPKRHNSDFHYDNSGSGSGEVHHHKLTREDSERPIASEKIKKKSSHGDKDHAATGMSIMSVFRYYTDKIRQSASKKKMDTTLSVNRGYVQQQLESHDSHSRRRKAQSYAHFLNSTGSLLEDETIEESLTPSSYDPFFLDNDTYIDYNSLNPNSLGTLSNGMRLSDLKREMNEQFSLQHPEIPSEMTLSKLRAIKLHLLEVGKQLDLEVSSIAHAYVYFEKLIIKNMVTKKNRKLLAACCLFLATKVNEAKGSWFKPLLEAIDNELDVDEKEIHEHEFAVFADLEFNLYVPRREFMPHFERIFSHVEYNSIQEYIGSDDDFYKVNKRV